jgi:hypothetical protein
MTSKTARRYGIAGSALISLSVFGCSSVRSELAPAESAVREASCTAEQRAETFRTWQAQVFERAPQQVAALDQAVAPSGELEGWRLSHGLVVLQGAGGVAVDNVRATDPMPQLLVYEPSPASTAADWLDHDGADGPYRLVGWAHLAPYLPGSRPPSRPCVAASEWLVHEAGFHLMDGGMLLTANATSEPARPAVPVHFWHPRVWDLHVWAGADGVPAVAFANPNAREGGVRLPGAAFLQVVNGRWQPARADPGRGIDPPSQP